MGEVAAVAQVHGEEFVPGLQHAEIHSHVGAGTGVGLHVGVFGSEELLGTVDGQGFRFVHVLAAPVPPLARVALGILVGQHAALDLHDGRAGEVFAGDELDVLELARAFVADDVGDLRVNGGE